MIKPYKISVFVLILFFAQLSVAQTANINLAEEHQLIRGFGGINVPGWIDDLTPAQVETAFGIGPGQIGMSILRVRIPHDVDEFEAQVPTAVLAYQQYGATVFGSPWSPPASMKNNNSSVSGHIKESSFADYAAHLKKFVDLMSDNGVDMYAVSVQNEPDIAVDYESCDWTSQEMINFLAGGHADNIGDVKIIAPESFQFRKPFSDALLNSSSAVSHFDIVGAHIYGGGLTDYPLARQKGKEVWMTEHYTESANSANAWPLAMDVGTEIHNCMVSNYSAYVWWYIRRSYGPITEDGEVSKRGYLLSQYSKYIRPGFVRVGATSSPASGLSLTAYKKGSDVVVVVVNTGSSSRDIQLNFENGSVSGFSKYTTSSSKSMQEGTPITVTGASTSVTVDGGSVTTFVSSSIGDAPDVELTAPENGASFELPTTIEVTANASDNDGQIIEVEFFAGSSSIGTDDTEPYAISWTPMDGGNYTITAVATDNDGNKTSSTSIEINTFVPQGAFGGTPWPVPGKIETEDYDVGGQGLAYNDMTPAENQSGTSYRNDNVDIEEASEGGYNLSYTEAGEWYEYTVNVEQAGRYDIHLRIACDGDDRTVHLALDETDLVGTIDIPNTGGWQTWETMTISNVNLVAGEQVLRLTYDVDYANINYFDFELKEAIINGIGEYGNIGAQLFPNPTKNSASLKLDGEFEYEVLSASSTIIASGSASDNLLLGDFYSKGVYFIKVTNASGIQNIKFTKK